MKVSSKRIFEEKEVLTIVICKRSLHSKNSFRVLEFTNAPIKFNIILRDPILIHPVEIIPFKLEYFD